MLDFVKALVSNALGGALSVAIVAVVGLLAARLWRLQPPRKEEMNLNGLWLAQFTYKLDGNNISKIHVIQNRNRGRCV